jgi:CheY-like chemotaxis protein
MNAILGYTHLALGTELNTQQVSYLETIQTSSNHLLRVINDILDISKIEAGKVELYHQMFTLEGLFNELSDLFKLDAKKKQVSLVFPDVSAMDLPVLFGDPVRIGQILINLISNSFKFTDEGKIEVLATHESISENRLKLSFAVIDTGIGIDKSQVDIIFDSFSQAATPSGLTTSYQAAKNEGAGLGLSICKHLVSLMGGAISVDSTPGVGSRFDFTIYVDVDQEQEILPANIRGRPIKSRSWLQGVHILLVEDNLINQQLTQEVLESEGLIVTLAENGAEAVEAMENQEFAAILMDLRMPVMDGFEALVLLRQNDKYNHIPILAMSAGALQHEIDNALKSGFDDYITKPVSFDKLFNKLLSLIDDRYFSDKIKSAAMVTPDTPECVSLLEIPEIDVMDAIDNHNNNISLFVRLLDDFVDYYEFAPSTIEEHLANREIEQAERLSHNVAGVAGSFAAKSLHKLAKDLEHAISAGDKSKWESILPQFSKELNSLTNSIKQSDLPAIKEKLNA